MSSDKDPSAESSRYVGSLAVLTCRNPNLRLFEISIEFEGDSPGSLENEHHWVQVADASGAPEAQVSL